MQKLTVFIFYIFFILFITTKVNGHRPKFVGGKSQVKDVKTNKEVQQLGKFSVEEYNKNLQENPPTSPLRDVVGWAGSEGPLRFIEVVEAQKQVVSGIKYYLKVEAMQNGLFRTFDAVVVVKPWVQSKQLLNFGPSPK